ncbi:xylose ABC transporter ATP-binding protein [Helicovermis profundi]|uniref:Xylose ABC transporter ATP-binding protein n=1 Tax=Helicovermis profundi TaxID=3065157 RepID=A0AAU9ENM1_9FIRM|nr:xylose ABC transporter ATP-binding protein [Clostridia bacterium S502]
MSDYILEMKDIVKEFPGVKALDKVSFNVKKGEIHALVGENGAGKSTLMKVLSGVYSHEEFTGDIILNGKKVLFNSIKDSENANIAIIYQELALVPQMTVGENIYLNHEPLFMKGVIDHEKLYFESQKLLEKIKLDINPRMKVNMFGVGIQQLIEIAKALSKDADVLILDEPTAALTEGEVEILFRILKDLKEKGVTCIIITHKLNEVFALADNVTVLRDGKTISTNSICDLDENKIISMMVGRELSDLFPKEEHTAGQVVMKVQNFSVYDTEIQGRKLVDNISFEIKKGEILGISGLMGAGRTELVMGLFGAADGKIDGKVFIEGKEVKIKSPHDAIKNKLALVTEDRKGNGLVLEKSIMVNTTLASLDRISKGQILNVNEEIKFTEKYVRELKTKTPSIEQLVKNLSGGNQQKVVIAKWLMTEPKILFLDEPTRGIDVGAKFEIYMIMNELVKKGVSVVMISSELPEILGMSDRILVMREGKFVSEKMYEEASQENIMFAATGGK